VAWKDNSGRIFLVARSAARRFEAKPVFGAGAIASLAGGVPSTLHALARGGDPLEASLAAGTVLLPRERRRGKLLLAAMVAHLALSFGWAAVLALALPRGRRVAWSPLAGLAIAVLDLGVVGRRFPRIRALPVVPQVADHVAYALTVAVVLDRRRQGA
jgi:hypothetical protein